MAPKYIKTSGIDDGAFSSQHGRNQPCPSNKHPCDWASCSLFSKERGEQMSKISPFKGKPYAIVNLAPEAGPRRLDPGGHLHLWRIKGYDMNEGIIEIVEP
jgi:hypothetical protein